MRYGTGPEVLRDVSLDLPPGSFHFLTGRAAPARRRCCGLMYLAERPTRGLISLFGEDIVADETARPGADFRRRIGVVFQDFRLLDHLSTFDNVALAAARRRGLRSSASARMSPSCSSGSGSPTSSMRARRPCRAVSSSASPSPARSSPGRQLLLADEPTGNVDDAMALRLLRLFEELNRLGTTMVLATHNEALTERLGYPRLHLVDGELMRRRDASGTSMIASPARKIFRCAATARRGSCPG